ncbi:hypothetical protein BV22DRAFT_82421 [Leucogyrophana mollusca]|uniref:Uncharacterized protein n=1 Tax=Leucogyrophana mollusca TaxID=85980 RepID=A0ACB8BYR5_9AGAM|nr:hypothetical protein BV22DRAFT_82421 [Leucogyrophana mollusca]
MRFCLLGDGSITALPVLLGGMISRDMGREEVPPWGTKACRVIDCGACAGALNRRSYERTRPVDAAHSDSWIHTRCSGDLGVSWVNLSPHVGRHMIPRGAVRTSRTLGGVCMVLAIMNGFLDRLFPLQCGDQIMKGFLGCICVQRTREHTSTTDNTKT